MPSVYLQTIFIAKLSDVSDGEAPIAAKRRVAFLKTKRSGSAEFLSSLQIRKSKASRPEVISKLYNNELYLFAWLSHEDFMFYSGTSGQRDFLSWMDEVNVEMVEN